MSDEIKTINDMEEGDRPHPASTLNQYQTVNVQCTRAKMEIYKIKEYIDKMTHADARARAQELFDYAYHAFDRLQAFVGSRG